MYIPALPSLNPTQLLKGHSRYLPFPLGSPRKLNFYVARNGIYHLMRSLGSNSGGIVLAPDYHHGNEIAAMKAAGVKLRYYPVKKNLDLDIDAISGHREQLEGKLQQRYGLAKDQARKNVDDWLKSQNW